VIIHCVGPWHCCCRCGHHYWW